MLKGWKLGNSGERIIELAGSIFRNLFGGCYLYNYLNILERCSVFSLRRGPGDWAARGPHVVCYFPLLGQIRSFLARAGCGPVRVFLAQCRTETPLDQPNYCCPLNPNDHDFGRLWYVWTQTNSWELREVGEDLMSTNIWPSQNLRQETYGYTILSNLVISAIKVSLCGK